MSTLNIENYENHRPQSFIYQNLEIVPEGSVDRTAAVLIGSSGGHANQDLKGLITIRSHADIVKKLWNETEEDDDSNIIAKAASVALTAGGGDPFYVLLAENGDTDTETEANWNKALTALGNSDRSMFVCPLTYDKDLQKLVQDKAVELSKAEVQKWKRVYCPVPPSGNPASGSTEIAVSSTAANIVSVVNTFTSSVAEAAAQRTCYIWTAGAQVAGTDEDGNITDEFLDNIYVAAGITALRASILPQQGLSRRVITWIHNIPNCYTLFDREDLNKIATGNGSGGCFIIAQDDEDSEVYVRHQLTNDMTRGVMYYEDSVGVNVDTICYGLKDIAEQYIGQYNNVELTLLEIKNKVADYLLSLTNTGVDLEARRIGPQISEVDLDSVKVFIDSTFKDRIIITADVVIPLPINQIHIHLNAFASIASATAA